MLNQSKLPPDAVSVNRWLRLWIAAAGMFFVGILYAWSIFKVPLGEEFGWSDSELAFNYTLTLCCYCLGLLAAGQLLKHTSAKCTLLISAAAILIGFYLSSLLDGNLTLLYFSYGCLSASGIGMAYNAIFSTIGAWFPDKKGTCSGILQMCFGISPLIIGTVAEAMFRIPSVGWRKTFLCLGITIAAVLVIASFIMVPPPPETLFPVPQGGRFGNKDADIEQRDYTTSEAVRRSSFRYFFLYLVLFVAVGTTIIGFARDLAISVGVSAALATTLVGVLSFFNGLGRIVSGLVLDRAGRRVALFMLSTLTVLPPVILLLAVFLTSVPLCICGMCLAGFGYGCLPPVCTTVIRLFYGTRHFSSNFGVVNLNMLPASFSASIASALLTRSGGYALPLIMLIVLALIGFMLTFKIRRP